MKVIDEIKNLPNVIFTDTFGLLGYIIVGFIVMIEALVVMSQLEFKSIIDNVESVQSFEVTVPIFVISLIISFIIGNILIEIFNFIIYCLYILALLVDKLKKNNSIAGKKTVVNLLSQLQDILTPRDEIHNFSVEFQQTFLRLVGDYFNLPSRVGNELNGLSKELTSKHSSVFKIHLFQFSTVVAKGMSVNFFIIFLYLFPIASALSFSFLALALIFYFGWRKEMQILNRKIYLNTYLLVLREKKSTKK